MRFLLDPEHRAFAASLDAMLTAADTPGTAREWGRGEHARGRALWARIADAGVFALAVPEAYEGLGRRPVDLAVAFVELGRHAVPGPLVETVTAAALLREPGPAKRLLPALASGASMATVAYEDASSEEGAFALDGDAADVRLSVTPAGLRLAPGYDGVRPSLDPARRLARLSAGGELLAVGPPAPRALLTAFYRFLSYFEPMRQLSDGIRAILFFDARGDAGLTRSWIMIAIGTVLAFAFGFAMTGYYDRKGHKRLTPQPA